MKYGDFSGFEEVQSRIVFKFLQSGRRRAVYDSRIIASALGHRFDDIALCEIAKRRFQIWFLLDAWRRRPVTPGWHPISPPVARSLRKDEEPSPNILNILEILGKAFPNTLFRRDFVEFRPDSHDYMMLRTLLG